MEKIGVIIQARMGSTRLPKKIMLNLSGKPILWHVVESCKKANVEEVIIATSKNKENDVIEEFCKQYKISFFRGSENDVLKRYYDTAKKFNLDIIVRITSDCPLISPEIINKAIQGLKQENGDYVSNISKRTYPRGVDAEVFTFRALEKINKIVKKDFEREHVTSFIYNNPQMFKIGHLITTGLLKRPDIRITIDTKEDFKLLKIIYENLYQNKIIPISQVVRFLNKNPELIKINQNSEMNHLTKNKKQGINQTFIKK
jgi:spore coat polysaccharide biosynthesis protein SpsF (cytidylyltransferase family)